jgi:hypothetical protein
MVFGFLKRGNTALAAEAPMDIPWEKNDKGRFWKLLLVRPEILAGRGGVAAFFHRGVKPGWVFVCAADDLSDLLSRAQDDTVITEYEAHGGVFVTWSFVKPEFRDGVVAHLRRSLRPELETAALDGNRTYAAPPVPVNPPA